jgi:hypothetical protein
MLIIDDYAIWWVSEARDEVWLRVFGFTQPLMWVQMISRQFT